MAELNEIDDFDYHVLFESICILIEDYLNLNRLDYMQPNFHATLVKDVIDLVAHTVNDAFSSSINVDVDISTIIEKIAEDVLSMFYKTIVHLF